jgi:single-strand DNA-binding protein
MAGSVNKVILIGNLGRDPEVRNLGNGNRVVSFSVATSDRWSDRQSGEPRERTEWHRVAIFDEKLGEIAERYLKKGSKVYLEGSLQTNKWTDKDGQERETKEVILARFRGVLTLLDSRSDSGGGYNSDGYDHAPRQQEHRGSPAGGAGGGQDLDDDIPF